MNNIVEKYVINDPFINFLKSVQNDLSFKCSESALELIGFAMVSRHLNFDDLNTNFSEYQSMDELKEKLVNKMVPLLQSSVERQNPEIPSELIAELIQRKIEKRFGEMDFITNYSLDDLKNEDVYVLNMRYKQNLSPLQKGNETAQKDLSNLSRDALEILLTYSSAYIKVANERIDSINARSKMHPIKPRTLEMYKNSDVLKEIGPERLQSIFDLTSEDSEHDITCTVNLNDVKVTFKNESINDISKWKDSIEFFEKTIENINNILETR